ncbi:MAG: SURF1 family protein [Dehalococcoidia bacterium]
MTSTSDGQMAAGTRGVRFKPSLPVTLGLLGLAFVVLVSLGVWQLARQRQADAAEHARDESVAAAPLEWRTEPPYQASEVDFHRVQVSGRWDNAHTMTLANVARYGTRGEEVVTPLQPDDGGPAILVNRGWYPLTERDRVLAQLASEPRATVEGLARAPLKPEGASIIVTGTTAGKTPDGSWAWFDIPSMSRELPYPVLGWRLLQGTHDPGDPQPPRDLPVRYWGTEVSTEPHMEYALTWFSLAAALAVIAALRLRAERRGSEGARYTAT